MTDTELLAALRKQNEMAGERYRNQLEIVATCSRDTLHLQLSNLLLRAQDCQQLAALLHQQEFHTQQKAEMAATAS